MDKDKVTDVALWTLPRLAALVSARKQAAYHRRSGADEHKVIWWYVIQQIDAEIVRLESTVTDYLGLNKFQYKREVVE